MDDRPLLELPKEDLVELIKVMCQNALTLDGLWFTAVEDKYGLDVAMQIDIANAQRYGVTEGRRIKRALKLSEGGISDLVKALNVETGLQVKGTEIKFTQLTENIGVLDVVDCPIQKTRIGAGRGEFPCKQVGLDFFVEFSKMIDPGFRVKCEFCPPDKHPDDLWCRWVFEVA